MDAPGGPGVESRFEGVLLELGVLPDPPPCVVGVSGGLDSMSLLHLLLCAGGVPPDRVLVAHVDHRMRPGSVADAEFVQARSAEWGVECRVHVAESPVRDEAEGRALRYRVFERLRLERGDTAVVMTGHTADDQAETVLFRIARGSGPGGLAGIRPRRDPSILRPLLDFWRVELSDYASRNGVAFVEDPSNLDVRWTRNRIRHEILPALETAVPGARAALVSLAETSRAHGEALAELLDREVESLATEPTGPDGSRSLDRHRLGALSEPVLRVLVQHLATGLGCRLGRRATVDLVRFLREAGSGRRFAVGRLEVNQSLDRVRFRLSAAEPGTDDASSPAGVRVDTRKGEGGYRHGSWQVGVRWGGPLTPESGFVAQFSARDVAFPLSVRPWRPGDRIELPTGKKKVKKILLEARIPSYRRSGFPVVADAAGSVLWVPALTGPAASSGPSTEEPLTLEIRFPFTPEDR